MDVEDRASADFQYPGFVKPGRGIVHECQEMAAENKNGGNAEDDCRMSTNELPQGGKHFEIIAHFSRRRQM